MTILNIIFCMFAAVAAINLFKNSVQASGLDNGANVPSIALINYADANRRFGSERAQINFSIYWFWAVGIAAGAIFYILAKDSWGGLVAAIAGIANVLSIRALLSSTRRWLDRNEELHLSHLKHPSSQQSTDQPRQALAPDDSVRNKRKITFNLPSGRSVSVEQFQHSDTYASLLEGTPNDLINNLIIERKKKLASTHDLDEPFLIPPKTYQDSRGGTRLPPVCCVAQLMSTPMNSEMHGSALSVVWFSDAFFDEPLATFIERSLKDIPWEQAARDFEF